MLLTDKIKQLPNGYRLFLSNTNGAFTRDSEIDTDDLKSLVSDLEAKTWALELLDLIDVDEDGIFNIHRDGKLIGYGPTAKDAIDSAVGFALATAALGGGE